VTHDVSVVLDDATRYGTASKLEVDGSPVKRTYLRFTVSATGGRPIASAVLTLTVASSSGAGSSSRGRAHVAGCAWSEATLSGKTKPQPTINAAILSAPAGAAAPGDKVAFDVKGAITGGDGAYCVALDTTSTDGVDYVSKEANAAGTRPSLAITVVR
jgi:hypothetical protein